MTAISRAISGTEDYYVSSSKEKDEADAAEAAKNKSQVTHDQFLQLLTTQLTHQDPLSPMQDTEMMGQMAQLQALDEQVSMTKEIVAMRLESQIRAGAEMIGMSVRAETAGGEEISGTVASASVKDGAVNLNLADGRSVPYANLLDVGY